MQYCDTSIEDTTVLPMPSICAEIKHIYKVDMYLQVPSRFDYSTYNVAMLSDHVADPAGSHVATSLPTALMQPNMPVKTSVEPITLWSLKEK